VSAQLPLALPHRPALGRADFVLGANNRDAVAWLDLWPDWPRPGLAIHGPRGAGKTRLTQVWAARSGAVSVTPEAIPQALPAGAGDRPAVVLDCAAPVADERGMLHLYNRLAEAGGWLLLAAPEPPARWRIALPDLRSRLTALPSVGLGPPDDALMAAVITKQFADRQIAVGADVIVFLVRRLERSLGAAGDVVAALDRASLAEARPITVPLAREVLSSSALIPE